MTRPTLSQILLCAALVGGTTVVARPALVQARDRATSDLSNVKQLAVGTIIYSADADDVLPLAYAPTPNGGRRPDAVFRTKGWDPNEPIHWAGGIYPYIKSAKIYEAVGAPRVTLLESDDPNGPGVGHAFNGLLHNYPATAVAESARALLFSQSPGFVNLTGRAMSNPEMTCVPNQPCRYLPAARGCGGTEPGTTSRLLALDAPQTTEETRANGETVRLQVRAFVDGSAKVLRFDGATDAPYSAAEFPWSRLAADGRPTSVWKDAHGCHPLLFRPDVTTEDPASAREVAR